MICVSIGRGRHGLMIETQRELVAEGARLVELRLDYIKGPVNVKRLLADRPCPVIVSCRRRRDGGKWSGTEQQRQVLLRAAIAEGAEYVDLEEDIAGQIPRFGTTKRIVSLHDFRKTPDDLEGIWKRLAGLDPDIIKICTTANSPNDNFRMFRMMQKADRPTVGLCMGEIGIPTRILAGKFGAPFTYATFSAERVLAPGQLSFEQMKNVYHYDQINSQTEVYGVIADPVGHSLSPLIHNAAFHQAGLNKVYVPIRVPREALGSFIEQAPSIDIRGLSVTIPHKEAVLDHLTDPDEAVRGIGACNTLVFRNGRRFGYNTDCTAAMESLLEAMRSSTNNANPLQGKTALLLGAGGVGKALAFGLLQHGATVVLADGDNARARQLAGKLGCRAVDWIRRHTIAADVLVNGTPVGMHPNVDESPFDERYLKAGMVVFDAVYNPENTLLIKNARQRGCTVVTGVEMFVRQACLQFKLFTGLDGPAELMRKVLKQATSPVKQ